MTSPQTAIVGLGYSVPEKVRSNDDKIFDWLHANSPPGSNLFAGLKYRRVLEPPQTVVDLMIAASETALAQANLKVDEVDLIIGYASVSKYDAPNGLLDLHKQMKMPSNCRCISVNTAYTNFLDGLKLANDMIEAKSVRNALVVVGNNWTGHMDYHQPVSIAAGDGAGAAVLGPTSDQSRFRLIDWDNVTNSTYYGAFQLGPRVIEEPGKNSEYGSYTMPLMNLNGEFGRTAFKEFGMTVPPAVVNTLLERHRLTGSDITLIPHQVSAVVSDAWQGAVKAKLYVDTLEELADMVSSSQAVNFAKCYNQIETDYVVILGVGMAMHATAMLYKRGSLA